MEGRRVYLVSLGFDITQVAYLISKSVIEDYDYFVFVTPSEAIKGRTEQTRAALEQLMNGLKCKGSNIAYEYLEVSEEDLIDDLYTVFNKVNSLNAKEVFVWAAGGTRAIVSLLVLYSQLDPRVSDIYTYSESKSKILKIPPFLRINPKISDSDARVLNVIASSGSIDVGSIIEETALSRSTVYKSITKLKKMGLIMKSRGKKPKIEITKLGKIILDIHTLMKSLK